MAAVAYESFRSPELGQDVDRASGEIRYIVVGDDDAAAALAAVVSASASTYGPLSLQGVHVNRVSDGFYEGTASYGTRERKAAGEDEFSFKVGGGTQHITNSLSTDTFVAAGNTAADPQGLIGVTESGVSGVEIHVPAFSFSVTRYIATENMTSDYLNALEAACAAPVNSDSVTINVDGVERTFTAGTLLFLGASGRKRSRTDWELSLEFAKSENVNDLAIGDITGIVKLGWQYLEVIYGPGFDEIASPKVRTQKPRQVNVHTVYRTSALSPLLA